MPEKTLRSDGAIRREEFAGVLPEIDAPGAVSLANEMRLQVTSLGIKHDYSEVSGHVTLSLGVATIVPERKSKTSDLINLADECFYNAKRGGRNRVFSS